MIQPSAWQARRRQRCRAPGRSLRFVVAGIGVLLAAAPCTAATITPPSAPTADIEPASDSRQLTRLSVEELAGLKVVTVSRRPEANLEAAGAVHVVTAEDIRRAGVVTLPDALRAAPGLQASRIDADEWALAIRGFASRLSRSVQVVVDGRSVWTPLFAGVFWDANDMLLENVEQVEVSRGPGGAVYGANALNGVISVTTRNAKDTLGGLLTASAGNADWQAAGRWGGRAREGVYYRVFGKYAVRDGTEPIPPLGYDDEWTHALGGFRLDARSGPRDRFTVQGGLYDGSAGQPTPIAFFTPPFTRTLPGDAAFRGHHLVTRWTHGFAGGGELTAQGYYDHTTRHEPHYQESRNTADLDVQHRLRPYGRHDLLWGASYRRSSGRFDGGPTLYLVPSRRVDDIAGVFANDEVRMVGGRLRTTVGAKAEWNDYSGWNVQPSARAAWVTSRQTFWASVARAVRTSSRIERDVVFYSSLSPTLPLFARATGSPDFEPESVVALEAGYKLRLRRLIVTASAFHNDYRDLAANEPGAPFVEPGAGDEPTRTVVPVRITNGPGGTASGVELKAIVSVRPNWRVQGSYSLLSLTLDGPAGTNFKPNSPRHQFWLASQLSPTPQWDLDLMFRAIGSIPGHAIPSFADVDARLAYRPRNALELAVVGANLLDARRPEFGGGFEVIRTGRLQATLRF